MSPATPRPRGRRVNVFQALALLLTFGLVAGVGGVLTAGLVMPAVAATSVVTDAGVRLFDELPSELEPQPLSQQSRMYAADGSLLATFFWQNRIVVPLENVSQHMIDAVIATEDHRFFEHGGVDVAGIARAAVKIATTDETQGASTLTQQYVKNVLINDAWAEGDVEAVRAARVADGAEGIARKMQEAKTAIALEKRMSKEEILEGYLNIAQFGASVYGVESAARHFFSVSAKDLNYLQAATIAGITQAPNAHDPVLNPEQSEARRNWVLGRMLAEGKITKEEYDAGRATPLAETLNVSEYGGSCVTAGVAAFFCDYVTKEIMNSPEFGETKADRRRLLFRGGLDIYTTIDMRMQAAADEELKRSVPVDDSSGRAMALATVEPGTGKILAIAQNRNYNPALESGPGETSVNYAANFTHGGSKGFPVGSTFKPFVLAEWLESGKSLNTIVDGNKRRWGRNAWKASCLGNPSYPEWNPANYDGHGRGRMTVLRATEQSINTAYASMTSQLDLCGIAETAAKVGFERADGRDINIVPSTSLGSEESSPLSLASAYATFGAGGVYCEPIAITRVVGPDGTELPVPSANCRQAIDPAVAATVTHALVSTINNGGARPARLAGGRTAAGKTGTTNENWHTWFAGYTPQLSTAVWLGNPDANVPMKNIRINGRYYPLVYGSSISAPTWARFMNRAHEGLPHARFTAPDRRMVEGERIRIPDVTGRTVPTATDILEDAGFDVRVRDRDGYSDAPKGTVGWTEPSGRAPAGTTITIIRSAGPEPRGDDGDDDSSRGGGRGPGNGRGPGDRVDPPDSGDRD